MRDTPEIGREGTTVSLRDSETGVLAGFWLTALSGYEWDSGLQLSVFDGPEMGGPDLTDLERESPWLRPTDHSPDALSRLYPVLRDRNLLRDFVSLAEQPSMDGIKRFADRWGLLGQSRRMFHSSWEIAISVESLTVWSWELSAFRPLWETWQAVTIMADVASYTSPRVRAAGALLNKRIRWSEVDGDPKVTYHDGDTVAAPSVNLPAPFDAPWPGGWSTIAASWLHPEVFELFRRGDTVEPARFHVCEAVNARLKGHVDLAVLPFHKRMRFFPDTLLTAIYVLFAQDLAGARGKEMTCEFCQQPFVMRRRDQRFCDKNCREAAGYHRRKNEVVNGQEG
jgi:hypothetical protein